MFLSNIGIYNLEPIFKEGVLIQHIKEKDLFI